MLESLTLSTPLIGPATLTTAQTQVLVTLRGFLALESMDAPPQSLDSSLGAAFIGVIAAAMYELLFSVANLY